MKFVTAVILILISCGGCFSRAKREVVTSTQTDDKAYVLELLRRDGGATTAYSYEVILRRQKSSWLSRSQVTVFQSYGYPVPVNVAFLADSTIQIQIDDGSTYETTVELPTLKLEQSWNFYKGEQE